MGANTICTKLAFFVEPSPSSERGFFSRLFEIAKVASSALIKSRLCDFTPSLNYDRLPKKDLFVDKFTDRITPVLSGSRNLMPLILRPLIYDPQAPVARVRDGGRGGRRPPPQRALLPLNPPA